MKRATKYKLKQLGIIIVAWMTIGFLISLYDHFVLLSANSSGLSQHYSLLASAIRNVAAGLIGALLGGSLLVFYVNVKYQDKPYAYTIAIVSVTFVLIILFITLLMGVVMVPINTGRPLSDPISRTAFNKFMLDTSHLKAGMVWASVVGVTQLLLQVNSKFGQGNFWNIIIGKYNSPKVEKKIFMFLDINSSTSIAERLGDEAYHELLKDFFSDITSPIQENQGSIYQYVGDEVVVAWNYEEGRENTQCLKCFFDIKVHIGKNREKYLNAYGIVPSFKAGLHYGRVIAGEIGIAKRDITYSGNVLNTTSRILHKCGELQEELIASEDLVAELQLARKYISRPLGAIKLKGKAKEIWLNALMPVG